VKIVQTLALPGSPPKGAPLHEERSRSGKT